MNWRKLWKARIRLFLRYWLVDTFGWAACWLPMLICSVVVWSSVTAIHLTRPQVEPAHAGPLMTDVGGEGFMTEAEWLEVPR